MSRLIDADVLYEEMTNEYRKHYAGTGTGYDFTIAMNIVQKQPTIEAVPVVHAKWIEVDEIAGAKIYKCSACGTRSRLSSKFCHECGADMRR